MQQRATKAFENQIEKALKAELDNFNNLLQRDRDQAKAALVELIRKGELDEALSRRPLFRGEGVASKKAD